MRELFSCSVQELAREAHERRTKARPKKSTGNLKVLLLLVGKFSDCMILCCRDAC
jgi:hypothetical protein